MNTEHRRMVAGVSTLDFRPSMIRWAAEEAAARGAELRLVTAVPPRAGTPERYLPSGPADAVRDAARKLLARAAERAAAGRPDLLISTEVVGGSPADVLREAAAGADVLVVGADDQTPFAEAITGSVPGTLLTTSPCPLVVVPNADSAIRVTAPALIAVDETESSHAALAYAFAAADRHRRTLLVLRCLAPAVGGQRERIDRARTLIGFGELYPHVEVTQETAVGDPGDVLAERSRRAALLVLGSRGRGRLASTLFGSVSRTLIRRSGCPIVVARPHAADLETGAVR